MNSTLQILQARASFAVAAPLAIPASAADEADIQWMPPGRQSPTCWVNGEPRALQFTCTASHAAKLDAILQDMLAKARAGTGDKPFTDFNHEDGAASSRPVKLYWAGDDLKTGGIRLKTKFTGTAKEGVRDGEWDRFSPQWEFDANTHEPVGITVNLGGLVNRAAFKNIQTVTAKNAETSSATLATGKAATDQIIAKAKAMAAESGITLAAALDRVCHQNETLYRAHTGRVPRKPASVETHPLMAQARALAQERNISMEQAVTLVAHRNASLYRDYRLKLVAQAGPFQQEGNRVLTAPPPDHEFIVRARKIAHDLSINVQSAMVMLAEQDYPLYQDYIKSCK